MYFATEAHKERFRGIITSTRKVYKNGNIDREYGAALYLLTCMPSVWEKVRSYVSADKIQFDEILEGVHLSTSEHAMVTLAGNLFNLGRTQASPVDLMALDNGNFEAAIQALRLRRDGARLEDFS